MDEGIYFFFFKRERTPCIAFSPVLRALNPDIHKEVKYIYFILQDRDGPFKNSITLKWVLTHSFFREYNFIFHITCSLHSILFFPLCCLMTPGFESFSCKLSHYFLLIKCYNFHAAKCFVQLCVVTMLPHCKLFD